MTNDTPDWIRLDKALAVEAENGFVDLMGRQYRFSEFLSLTFGKFPQSLPAKERSRWHHIAFQFAEYPDLAVEIRQQLVAEVKTYLYQLQQQLESGEQQHQDIKKQEIKKQEIKTQEIKTQEKNYSTKTVKTTPIVTETSRRLAPKIEQKLSDLPEIGIKRAENLSRLDLSTVRDLLFYYPRDYIDYARQVNIQELQGGETVTIIAEVKRCNCFTSPKNQKLSILELLLKDKSGQIKVSRFYAGARFSSRGWQESLKRRYAVGSVVAACGLVKASKYGLTLDNPEIEVLANPGDAIESFTIGRVVPIYGLTEGVVANTVRQAVMAALPAAANLKDPLPVGLRKKYELMELKDAIPNIHFPKDSDTLKYARRRLVFDEFFYLQLGLLQRQKQAKAIQTSAILAPKGKLLEQFNEILPFKFTNAQQRVINDILNDLQKPTPMNRLVQGDVGSGKTVVAVVAILAAIQSGYQAALMAPTEVLAEQHYRKLVSWFNLLHLPVELLTGSTKTAKRREIHSQLETGELPLLVGTHALIQDKVNFQRLGLVVIDEQHRFGVEQRAKLQQKGEQPHVLTMTATPIPRTLALTVHGDLDVSQIDELPPGRQAIKTSLLTGQQRPQAYDLIRREIAQGRQIYVVLPLVEESEKLDLRSAIDEHQKLQESVFPEFQVGLLHGRMTSAEKEEAINKFRDNETQILVSTTVVEVGVDVPNATVMLIEHAERFGLSQLHQLRGRVGRGAAQSYCLLMSSSRSPDAQQRLMVLVQSQDGFFISEMDMRFRGPGEVMGTRQSGVADFTLASLVEDEDVLLLARQAAEKVIDMDASLARWTLMRDELQYRYTRLMGGAILT
ncbi:ATP-dependent DNA helicase RecG [Sphaerospermopsis kisseleviana CS-549]|uniref:ATP-dependent DNA helicase RecG n=1 Tax=Sphaerospermopsis kisseleviana CS-549 TaxID=3021783 RepID=A0ABT4ZUK0_9CYAN|nr:ATP-dependent DNA helicase RecG [Sphaerospermopsis kisseleviana]MDB9442954.1 ATP-dependent DNA helicase RecG [Sphaerospermopsis kisseleviana CS-549]BAZ80803.1 ATP-dependent DNA helicase RecG [Sphaerospermopsis kisseleviana NIES-73]